MFKIGKIPPEILEAIVMKPIEKSRVKRDDVVLRPKTGEDCSAVDVKDEYCVFSTDPITGASKDMGYLAVQINCNDIFSSGAEPVGILLTVLLPENSDEWLLEEIMTGAEKGAEEMNIEILGGHTEVTDAVRKPIISATVIGKTLKRNLIKTGGARQGQDAVMTKWAGIEGTSIIAYEYEKQLSALVSADIIKEAQGLKKYLSVGKEAMIAVKHGATAMHDATEGGILGALWEMAECSGLGVKVYKDNIPVREETKKICALAHVDPLRLISSGSMVIAANKGEELVKKLKAEGIEGTIIGRFTDKERVMLEGGERTPLGEPESDEIYRVSL